MRRRILGMVASCALAACGGAPTTADDPEAQEIYILDWLTSGSELAAMDSLRDLLRKRVPHIQFTTHSVEDPPLSCYERCADMPTMPDSFEGIGGADLLTWAKKGALVPIDALAVEQGWRDVFPEPVLASTRLNGTRLPGTLYGVPLDLERDNTLFYNKALFTANGITPPTSIAGALEAARAFDAKGMKALAVSAAGGWTIASMLFEEILVAEAGPDFVESYLTGRATGDAPEMRAALTDLAALFDYANPDRTTTGWGDAVKRLCAGESAMLMIPDFAKGQLKYEGCFAPDKVGYVPLEPPGAPTFVFVGLAFNLTEAARHPRNGMEFLRVVGSKEGQESFNRIKLTVPPRLDADVSDFDFMTQQETAEYRAPGERLVLGYSAQASSAFQEVVHPALQRFADPASPDYKNVDTVLTVLRDNYDKILP
jgi:glucose/mannose transport system substrate-binding protein